MIDEFKILCSKRGKEMSVMYFLFFKIESEIILKEDEKIHVNYKTIIIIFSKNPFFLRYVIHTNIHRNYQIRELPI